MLTQYQQLLERLRTDTAAWDQIAFKREAAFLKLNAENYAENKDHDYSEDPSYQTRFGVLVCLQYDRRTTDHALLRFLLEQETASRSAAPFQGESVAHYMAAYLLVCFQDVTDVWRLWEAKTANFDTFCGFSNCYLFAGGIESTLDYVKSQGNPLRDFLQEHLDTYGTPSIEDMKTWWNQQQTEFPVSPLADNPLQLMERSLVLGRLSEAQKWLDYWEAEQPTNEQTLHALAYYRKGCQQHREALAAALQWANLQEPTIDDEHVRASNRLGIIDYAIGASDFSLAWNTLQEVLEIFRRHPEIKIMGMTLSALNTTLALCDALPADDPEKRRALYLVESLVQEGFATSLVALKKAAVLAASLNEPTLQKRYQELAKLERKRIDKELKG